MPLSAHRLPRSDAAERGRIADSARRQDQRFTRTKNTRQAPPRSVKKENESGALIPGNHTKPKSAITTIFIKIISKD